MSSPIASSSAICNAAAVFSRPTRSLRSRSIARLRAAVNSHAVGSRGTPRCGHVRSACSQASCQASSARSKSWVTLIRVATARPVSSR